VYGGALLYVFSKSAKFSLFKPAEEMVYITLDEQVGYLGSSWNLSDSLACMTNICEVACNIALGRVCVSLVDCCQIS
jgi:hypothetical protein